MPKGAQEADGVDGVRVAVRQQLAAGADWIKFYADYRRASGEPATATFSLAEMQPWSTRRRAPEARRGPRTTDAGTRRAVLPA